MQAVVRFKFLVVFFICISSLHAQYKEKTRPNSELGVFGGGSFYMGDLAGVGEFYKFIRPGVGLMYRYNFNPRWGLRANALYGNVAADDAKSSSEAFRKRNLNFRSMIGELSAQLEFNYLEYKFGTKKNLFSSYLFGGLGAFRFNPKTTVDGQSVRLQPIATENRHYTRVQPCIPFGMGFKQSLGGGWGFSVEAGFRKTFTDYIDDVSTVYYNPEWLASKNGALSAQLSDRSTTAGELSKDGQQRGNSKTKDWYSFVGIILSFKIHEKPENCAGYN